MSTPTDPAMLASDLRVVLGVIVRRMRVERAFSLSQATVLSRLDREGTLSVSQLATQERVRPQSMARTVSDLESAGMVARRPDPDDGRRALVELTAEGLAALETDRQHMAGWLAKGIAEDLSAADRQTLREALEMLRRLGEK